MDFHRLCYLKSVLGSRITDFQSVFWKYYSQLYNNSAEVSNQCREHDAITLQLQQNDTDDEDDGGLNQQTNTKDVCLKELTREKFYEERLKELLAERQGLIDKLQAHPDPQVSRSSAMSHCNVKKLPAGLSVSAANLNTAMVYPKNQAAVDTKPWREQSRHQIRWEEATQKRTGLESLMAEQRQKGLYDSYGRDAMEAQHSEALFGDERTVATWGGSTPCLLDEDEDGSHSEAEDGDEEEDDDETGSSSSEDEELPIDLSVKRKSPSARASKEWCLRRTSQPLCGKDDMRSARPRQQRARARRQENARWASDLSCVEEEQQHWQEHISQLQKQLDLCTRMCQKLLHDQQMMSCMLQSLFPSPYSMLPSSATPPQVYLIMNQLNQCYSQLAWQQSNIQRLKHVLNGLHQQQPRHKSATFDSAMPADLFPPLNAPPPWSSMNMTELANFPLSSSVMDYWSLTPPPPSSPRQQQATCSPSVRAEHMASPQPYSRTTLSGPDKWIPMEGRSVRRRDAARLDETTGRAAKHQGQRTQSQASELLSHGITSRGHCCLSSLPDPTDPTIITHTVRSRKASAQASLASKHKVPKKNKKCKGHSTRPGQEVDIVSNARDKCKISAPRNMQKQWSEMIPDKHLHKKLDNKLKISKTETSCDVSAFEALRETIYSEAASLITQNETRSHFLIELFHKLQLLNTDYLRQRALAALQGIVSRQVTDPTAKESLDASNTDSSGENAVSVSREMNDADSGDDDRKLSLSSVLDLFANEDLGNTVIHVDQVLARTRDPELMKLSADYNGNDDDASASVHSSAITFKGACDGNDDSERADVYPEIRCPRINTQELDRQINAIMAEVLPLLKDHMKETCSPQLLSFIRQTVLALTPRMARSAELSRFLHAQLGAVLQKSLVKFAGRLLKECGEDLLVELSEILFNELAFIHFIRDDTAGSRSVMHQSFSTSLDDEDKDRDETEQRAECKEAEMSEKGTTKDSGRDTTKEEEEEEGEELSEALPLSISLSKAEAQALTNYGSGEDENEDDELEDFEAGPLEVQISLQVSSGSATEQKQGADDIEDASQEPKSNLFNAKSSPCDVLRESAAAAAGVSSRPDHAAVSPASASPETDSSVPSLYHFPVMMNAYEGRSGDVSQKSDEDDFVKV